MNSEKLSEKRVLILGCGDIGERLAGQLPAEQFQVTGLRRHPPATDTANVHYRACDVTDRAALAASLGEGFAQIVITMTPAERSDEGYRRAYVATCENLLHSLRAQKQTPELIVFVSSSGVYGQHDGSWVDETSPAEPANFSGKRLLEAEQLIATSGFAYCIVRFSGIYGPGRNRLIEQVRQGRAVLSGSYTNRIHADDCAGVLAHLLQRQARGQSVAHLYLASDSKPAPMAEVVAWLSMQLKTDRAIFAPEQPSERGNKRCSNQRLLASGFQLRYPDYQQGYSAVLRELGYG